MDIPRTVAPRHSLHAGRIGGLSGVLFLFVLFFSGTVAGEEGLVSTTDLMDAVAAIDGIRIVAAEDIPGTVYTEDYGASQVLEIIRPDMGPISVGRISTTCSCLAATMAKRTFAQGERAFIEVRNVKPSQPNGAVYGIFALLASPYRAALQYELFVKSDRKPGDPVEPAASAPHPAPEPAAGTVRQDQ